MSMCPMIKEKVKTFRVAMIHKSSSSLVRYYFKTLMTQKMCAIARATIAHCKR